MLARGRERGQAFLETAVALPAVLVGLTFLFWSMKYGILAERIESMARYSNLILPSKTLYGRESILSLYSAALGKPVADMDCTPPPTNWLGVNGTALVNGVTMPRGKLWSEPVQNGWCRSGYLGFTDANFTRDYVLGFTRSGGSARFLPPILGSLYGAQSAVTVASKTANMFDAASVGVITGCFPDLAQAVKASLLSEDTGSAPAATDPAHIDDPPPETSLRSASDCHNEVVQSLK